MKLTHTEYADMVFRYLVQQLEAKLPAGLAESMETGEPRALGLDFDWFSPVAAVMRCRIRVEIAERKPETTL